MKVSYRRITLRHIVACERLVLKTTNHLRANSGLELLKYRPSRRRNRLMSHLLKTDPDLSLGAFVGQQLVGYASALVRDDQWYLAFLFVDSRVQGQGIGRALLERVLAHRNDQAIRTHSLCTFAYNPTAIALYSSFGFAPMQALPLLRWDLPKDRRLLRANPRIRSLPLDSYDQIETLNRIDKQIRGIYRPEEHKLWLDSSEHRGYLFKSGRTTIGYAYIGRRELMAPICATAPEFLKPLFIATLNLHLQDKTAKSTALWIPGSQGDLLKFALGIGFRILELDMLMTDRLFYRDDCYIPATLALF